MCRGRECDSGGRARAIARVRARGSESDRDSAKRDGQETKSESVRDREALFCVCMVVCVCVRVRESEREDFSFPSPASVSLLARESMENSFSSWSFARNSFILHASSSTRDSCVESELFVSQASEDGGLDGHGNVELDVVHVMFPLRGP